MITPLGVNFITILCTIFSYKRALHSLSLITIWLCNFLAEEYVEKAACKMLVKSTPTVGSISPILYEQLLCSQTPKVQKNTQVFVKQFLHTFGNPATFMATPQHLINASATASVSTPNPLIK